MAQIDDSGNTAQIGRVFFPSGKPAHGTKERAEAIKQQENARAQRNKNLSVADMNARHPAGLAELRTADGKVARPSGAKPWL